MTTHQYEDYLTRRAGSFYGEMGRQVDQRMQSMWKSPSYYATSTRVSRSGDWTDCPLLLVPFAIGYVAYRILKFYFRIILWFQRKLWPSRKLAQLGAWVFSHANHWRVNLVFCLPVGLCLVAAGLTTGFANNAQQFGILFVLGAIFGWFTIYGIGALVYTVRFLIAAAVFNSLLSGALVLVLQGITRLSEWC